MKPVDSKPLRRLPIRQAGFLPAPVNHTAMAIDALMAKDFLRAEAVATIALRERADSVPALAILKIAQNPTNAKVVAERLEALCKYDGLDKVEDVRGLFDVVATTAVGLGEMFDPATGARINKNTAGSSRVEQGKIVDPGTGILTYEGGIQDGVRQGFGTGYYADTGKMMYRGEWANDAANGLGEMFNSQTGACSAKGRFVNDQLVEGTRYYKASGKLAHEGKFKNWKAHGFGTRYDEDTGKPIEKGQFANDELNGPGESFHPEDGGCTAKGEFVDGVLRKGTLYYANGKASFEGECDEKGAPRCGSGYDTDGNKIYEGEFKDAIRNGKGSAYDEDGELYCHGVWSNDRLVEGTLYDIDGKAIYAGKIEFRAGSDIGTIRKGAFEYSGTWEFGRLVEGTIKKYIFQGMAPTLLYKGELEDLEPHGHGTWTEPEKLVRPIESLGLWTYTGEWENGKKHGKGSCYFYATYHTQEGYFENDVFMGPDYVPTGPLETVNTTLQTRSGPINYKGDMRSGLAWGNGSFTTRTGATFKGSFSKGYFQGPGTLQMANGSWFKLDFVNEKRPGYVHHTLVDAYLPLSFSGKGTAYDAQRKISYSGTFKYGALSSGKATHANGVIERGQFKQTYSSEFFPGHYLAVGDVIAADRKTYYQGSFTDQGYKHSAGRVLDAQGRVLRYEYEGVPISQQYYQAMEDEDLGRVPQPKKRGESAETRQRTRGAAMQLPNGPAGTGYNMMFPQGQSQSQSAPSVRRVQRPVRPPGQLTALEQAMLAATKK